MSGDSEAHGRRLERLLAHIMLSLLAVGLVLVLGECAARAVLRFGNDPERFVRYASARDLLAHPERYAGYFAARYTPHRYLGYVPTPGFRHGVLIHNSLGYKDDEIAQPKPQGEYRIVCMGGSTTYGTGTADTKSTYPNQLERLLHEQGYAHVNVINAGVEGWTSYEQLIAYALRVQDLQPDLLLLLVGINDTYARVVWPHSAYQSDNSGYRSGPTDAVYMPGVFEYSALLRVFMIKAGWAEPQINRFTFGQGIRPTFLAEEWTRQHIENRFPNGVFKEVTLGEVFRNNAPDPFFRNLENLMTLARRHGAASVLLSEPVLGSHGRPEDAVRLWSAPEFIEALNESNARMRAAAETMGEHYYDLGGVYPKEARYYIDGLHLNEEGTRVQAELLAQYLVSNQMLGR